MRMITLFAMMFLGGCLSWFGGNNQPIQYGTPPEKNPNAAAVVIGMEYSTFAGACPGALKDSQRMFKLWSAYTDNIVLFNDMNATKSAVVAALKNAIDNYELVYIYYSGHGGSGSYNAQEVDGKDEFLCLYDAPLVDDAIWEIISKSKGRVFLMFDCCHSQTMFRSNTIDFSGSRFRAKKKLWAKKNKARSEVINVDSGLKMLCWSGCPDDTVSYGSSAGGMFTNSMLDKFRFYETYAGMWKKVSTDRTLLRAEKPQQTIIGSWDLTKPIFK